MNHSAAALLFAVATVASLSAVPARAAGETGTTPLAGTLEEVCPAPCNDAVKTRKKATITPQDQPQQPTASRQPALRRDSSSGSPPAPAQPATTPER